MNGLSYTPTIDRLAVRPTSAALMRLRVRTGLQILAGLTAAFLLHELSGGLPPAQLPYFYAALIGASAFVYPVVALERDRVGLAANLCFGGAVFLAAPAALHQPLLFAGVVFLAQGLWSGWVAALRSSRAFAPDGLWTWSVLHLTLAALV